MGNRLNTVISSFRREVGENFALVDRYAASSGNFLPTLRDNLDLGFLILERRAQSSRIKNPRRKKVIPGRINPTD
jgi:hypothetical protein